MNDSIGLSESNVIADEQLALVAGGDPIEDGHTAGGVFGNVYWGARNFLSETVYPYWLD